MSVSYHKVKSVPKQIQTSNEVSAKVLRTMATVSDIVGSTLGPGGRPVLIERQEYGLPNIVTKDGVTVFRSLGFQDAAAHCIMEAARDASVRTANEAGDGTTTATVLAHAIIQQVNETCKLNPRLSPQKVTRDINAFFKDLEPHLRSSAVKVSIDDKDTIYKVAKLSANGDGDLAEKVTKCFGLVGDAGNVTITEESGPASYEVELINGYPVTTGYEDSCGRYYPQFINDKGTGSVRLEKPLFVLNYGKINDIQSLMNVLEKANDAWQEHNGPHNIVLVSTGFSDQVLSHLAVNFPVATTLNVYPLIVPMSPSATGQLDFLEDLAAITGGKVLSNLGKNLDNAELADLGYLESGYFEATRYRSNVIGIRDEILIMERVDILQKRLKVAGSQLDATILQERIGKVSGGIAKLRVIGSSTADVKERRDRAEDAICAVRGALAHGYFYGGGWGLIHALKFLEAGNYPAHVQSVVSQAFVEPIHRMLGNAGLTHDEANKIVWTLKEHHASNSVYDALRQEFVNPVEHGILDSAPAVIEAIRNSVSIATVLGTLGGVVVFPRDVEFERQEAKEAHEYLRNAGEAHPASE